MRNDLSAAQRDAVKERSGGVCERCFAAPATDTAHRLPRDARIHDPENIGHLCRGCHSWCHSKPKAARREGWILPANSRIQRTDIQNIPVRTVRGWALLRSYMIGARLYSYRIEDIPEATAVEILHAWGVTEAVPA